MILDSIQGRAINAEKFDGAVINFTIVSPKMEKNCLIIKISGEASCRANRLETLTLNYFLLRQFHIEAYSYQ